MKIATVAACPVFGGKLARIDDSTAIEIKGVRQVVRLDDAVAVVADHMWAAIQGLAALDIEWDEGPNAKVSSADIVRQMETALQKPGVVGRKDGDVAKAMAGAAMKVEAVYQVPFLAHATMEPMNAQFMCARTVAMCGLGRRSSVAPRRRPPKLRACR
jgi:isoquinoline 1-oxidoreductase beta subunit